MNNTLTKADLVELTYKNTGLPRKVIGDVIGDTLENICQSLESGEDVKISSFGTFNLRDKKQRIGRNPKTGVEAIITPRRVVNFKASSILKKRVEV